ncbi:protein-tyrosine-phosphatase MKP1-like [Forsythia ovata]|uniref:Protein-tyrosine-phosphatase MKP1-like n=1 Tax=Forsythia ovata TaxID=205694 RepID=A0ABD1W5P3_9LAMI
MSGQKQGLMILASGCLLLHLSGMSSNDGGERLKLDLSNIQRNPNSNGGGLVKRENIALFDKECSKVVEHIYLRGDAVARDREIIKQHDSNLIRHIWKHQELHRRRRSDKASSWIIKRK